MHTPTLKGRVVIGLCLVGILAGGCTFGEQPEGASQPARTKRARGRSDGR